MTKSQRIDKELSKVRGQLSALQEKLKDLEEQKRMAERAEKMDIISLRTLQTGSGLACGHQRNKAFYGTVWRQGIKGGQSADTHPCNACGA